MSHSDLITKAKLFTPSSVTYKPAKANTRGGKSVQCQLNAHPIVLQFPLMLTWGVNERVDESSGRVSYDMALQFDRKSSTSVAKFQRALQDFQEKVLSDATGPKCKEWFGKNKMSKEVAEAMMYPILKYPRKKDGSGEPDMDRDPTMKLKLPYWDDKFTVELYNLKRQPLFIPTKTPNAVGPQGDKTPVDLVPKASYVKGLLACTGIWMAGGRFGVTWKLLQASVRPPIRLVGTGTCHIMDDSDDEEAMEALEAREKQRNDETEESTIGPSFSSSDSEEEEEAAVEAKPETPPAPKKKKKVVRRKKKAATAEAH